MNLQTHLSYFLGNIFFGDDGFQNMFVYQLTFSTLELTDDKGNDYVIGWKSKGVYSSKLTPLYTAFLHNMKRSGYRIRIQLNNSAVKQNNYATKIVNAYIAYDLDDWSKYPNRIFKLKNYFFGATNIRKNSAKSK